MKLRGILAMLVALATMTVIVARTASSQEGQGEPAPGTEVPNGGPLSETEEAIVDALRRTMELLSSTIDSVIVYELPEVLPNGDIIIRRKQRLPEEEPPTEPEDEPVQL